MKFVFNLWVLLATLALFTPQPTHSPFSDLPRLLFAGVSVPAIVDRCEEVQFRSGGLAGATSPRYDLYDHIPIARTPDGVEAVGSYKLGEDWCRKQVGRTVTVRLHPDDPQRSIINSYVQFWMLPVHILIVFLLFFVARFRPKAWRFVFWGYLIFVSGSILSVLYI
jgi:hypothetical protein